MGRFRIFLIAAPHPIDAYLPAESLTEVRDFLRRGSFIEGILQEADEAGTCSPFLIPANRVQMIVEM